jgi:peptide-methionine (S)-S-oxide reductase
MQNKILITIFMLFISSKTFAKKTYNSADNIETIILAGGCFWGVEELFRQVEGVIDTEVGYTGGTIENPNYEIVSGGLSGHAESVKIIFDNKKISLEKILKFFFTIHDPTQLNRQQNDIGTQYRSEIFYQNSDQEQVAKKIIKLAEESGLFPSKIQTKISVFTKFYPAEKYHQDYLVKNPKGYTCHFIRKEWVF